MSARWSEADVNRVLARQKVSPERRTEIASLGGQAKARKYRNQPVEVDGLKFPSIKQAEYYQQLKLEKAAGAIRGFACEVTIPLPSGKRSMRIDFLRIELDGQCRWIDTKGFVTRDWAVKRDELQHSLGITIETQ